MNGCAESDGMVWGEGCASVVLQARSDAHRAYSQLSGVATNRTSTLSPIGFADAHLMGKAACEALSISGVAREEVAFTHVSAVPVSFNSHLMMPHLSLTHGCCHRCMLWAVQPQTVLKCREFPVK